MTAVLDTDFACFRQPKSDKEPKKNTQRRVSSLVGDARKRQLASIRLSNLVNIARFHRENGEVLDTMAWLKVIADTLASAPEGKHRANLEKDRKVRWWYGLDALSLDKAARDCGLEYTQKQITEALEEALASWRANPTQKPLGPYDIARMLGVTKETRRATKSSMVFAVDESKQDRDDYRRERKRQCKEDARRKNGAIPRAEYEANSLSRTKPWEAEGISRQAWYKRRKACQNSAA